MTHTLFKLLSRLEAEQLWYRIDRTRPDTVRVDVTVVGERVEFDVFEDGHVEYARFKGSEDAESGDVDALIGELSQAAQTRPRSLEQKIARAKRKAATPVPDKPSPAKGVAMLRKGKAEAGLAGLRAKGKAR